MKITLNPVAIQFLAETHPLKAENLAGTVKKNRAMKEAAIYRQCMDNRKVAHLNK